MKQYSIKLYVAWLTLTPLLIVTVSLESFFLQDNFSSLDQNLMERGQLIARQLASSSEYGVFANNQEFLQNIAQGVMQQPDVRGVFILDANSGVLVEAEEFLGAPKKAVVGANTAMPDTDKTQTARIGKVTDLVNSQRPIYRSSNSLWIYQPIVPVQVELDEPNARHEVKQMGAVIVEMSNERNERHKSQMLWLTVGSTALFLTFTFYLISLGSRKITFPIRRLSEAIRALGDGLLETRVTISAPVSELNTLTRGINDMATKLQQEQVMLQQRSAKLIEAQRIAHLGNWERDVVNNTVIWSDEIYRIFGLAPQQIVPTYEAFMQAVHPDDRQFVEKGVREAFELGLSHSMEHRIQLPDGTVRYVYEQVEALRNDDGMIIKMLGTTQDITERKQAEESLRKLSQAVEQSPSAIVITDLDANIEYVNQAFIDSTGYSLAETIGQNPRLLHSGQTPGETYEEMWAHLKRGEIWKGEFTNKRKDGSVYIESALMSPVRQPDGSVTHYLAIKDDITERKRMESEFSEQLDELRRWHNATSGREERILDLKHEVNELLAKTGQQPRYPSAES